MAIVWCSPSPHKSKPKSKVEEHGKEEEEDENVQQLEDCARFYKRLEDCLVKTDRNWRACQNEVKALRECNDAKAKKSTSSSTTAQAKST
uniref:CHCH domain-containing protein n=1 Tax=Physcomitrium patens TaxID=3218 RepID=A0A2K1L4N1_PHYPA|nr:hypothetical protein PHYPA_003765 [Physcomitrium patens]